MLLAAGAFAETTTAGAVTTVGEAACHAVLRGTAVGATTTATLALPVLPACLARQSEPINFDIRSS